MPSSARVEKRIWWFTVSNAADRSGRKRTDERDLALAGQRDSVTTSGAVSVDQTEGGNFVKNRWLDITSHSKLITITAHTINDDWKMDSFVLQTCPLFVSHTGVNIGKVLKEAVEECGLSRGVQVAVMSDDVSNERGG
ncbi:hypothetical protein N1851_025338 [Merluccius polli]|uniref:Uncharacterized protein n=1 Tax=Merluccius polli TaxID=89951 RepID=A0AA47MDN0_MERPO|nr:hypothetical protein N1851_025338 [Merluccius polli]